LTRACAAWTKRQLVATVEILLLVHLVAAILAIKFIKYPNRPEQIVISQPKHD
jgi:hypothetical protein